ncbi:MAG: hypothetical protein FD174_3944 [Geobacteraceae bacterium]|nr:MAG: hypothetical protein FD174_3944 [Geobacteraceae bacterium]
MRISEQAKQESRVRILEKGAELFIGKGFEATTTRDIALAAGLAAGTLQPLCLTKDWQNTLEKLADIEQMLLMETDYEQEARFGKEARLLFSDADRVVVPQVYEEYCTKRVLTTEYLRGCHLDEFLAKNPSQEGRDHFTHLRSPTTTMQHPPVTG